MLCPSVVLGLAGAEPADLRLPLMRAVKSNSPVAFLMRASMPREGGPPGILPASDSNGFVCLSIDALFTHACLASHAESSSVTCCSSTDPVYESIQYIYLV